MADQAKAKSEPDKDTKLADLQKQIDKLVEERERLKGEP